MLVAWKMQRRRLQEGVRASWRSREGKVAQKGLGIEGKNMWWREERKHTTYSKEREESWGIVKRWAARRDVMGKRCPRPGGALPWALPLA